MPLFNYNRNRDAWATIRGFVYQVDLTIFRWLQLRGNQHLELECGEDIDAVAVEGVFDAEYEEEQVRCLEQVKQREKNVSLASAVAREAMANFSDHLADNPDGFSLTFRFFTTAGVATEQRGLSGGRAGITVWESLRNGVLVGTDADAALYDLRTYLSSLAKPGDVRPETWARFERVVADAPPGVLRDFIERFEWAVGAPDSGEIQRSAKQYLVDHYSVSPAGAEPAYARLFLHVFGLLTNRGIKRLNHGGVQVVLDRDLSAADAERYHVIREDVQAVMDYLKVELPLIREGLADVHQEVQRGNAAILAHLDARDPNVIWRTFSDHIEDFRDRLARSSAPLLEWKTTLEDGTEIERPEFISIRDRLLGTQRSTTLLLGPPGVGKSALLAKLGLDLQARGIVFWAIKADAIPRSVNSLLDLSREYFPSHVSAVDVVRAFAEHVKVVVLLDQLDAVSQLMDQKSDRLMILLRLISELARIPNVHIVASSREFEAKYDTRLKSLELQRETLTLPDRAVVEAVLSGNGLDPASAHPDMIEMLRTPWNLNTFLELRDPDATFTNDIALREAFWNKQVMTAAEGRDERVALVERLSLMMLDDEDLWLSVAAVGGETPAMTALESSGILLRGPTRETVGFRHQTLFEFSLTRQFASEQQSLPEVVKTKENSLFVRPLLIHTLRYLRDMRPPVYANAIRRLASPQFRRHIRALMIEFLSRMDEPSDDEVAVLISILERESEAPKVFAAVAGKRQWFGPLVQSPEYEAWLMRPALQDAWRAAYPLRAATAFALDDVLDYVRMIWLPNSDFDRLTFDILQSVQAWTPAAVEILVRIVRRSASWSTPMILEQVVESVPDLAPEVLRAELDRRLEDADREAAAAREAQSAEEPVLSFFDRTQEPYRVLINRLPEWHDLGRIPAAAPLAFVREIWPWYEAILDRLRVRHPNRLFAYNGNSAIEDQFEPDEYPHPAPIVSALKIAIEQGARADADWFLNFVRQVAGSEDLLTHRLLAYGFVALAHSHSREVLAYLQGDPRRLRLGFMEDDTFETELLVRVVAPHLEPEVLNEFADGVRQAPLRRPVENDLTTKQLERVDHYERYLRFTVLDAIPTEYRPSQLAAWLDAEAETIPGARVKAARSRAGWVGARLTAAEMEESTNEQLMAMFDQLPDAVAWEDPTQLFADDVSRGGGSIQQARELTRFAVKHPDRAQALLARLEPGQHERYAASAIIGLVGPQSQDENESTEDKAPETEGSTEEANSASAGAEPGPDSHVADKDGESRLEANGTAPLTPPATGTVPTVLIEDLIEDLVRRGFDSDEFKTDIAQALSQLARRDKGLSARMIDLLTTWYFAMQHSPRDDRDLENVSDATKHTSIFHGGYNGIVVGGRGLLLSALMDGYLSQVPADLNGWIRLAEAMLPYERHPDIWGQALLRLPVLFNLDRVRATRVLDEALRRCPALFGYRVTLMVIAQVIGFTEPREQVNGWLDRLLDVGTPFALNGYGQLLIVYYIRFPETAVEQRIRELLQPDAHPKLLLGLGHAAAFFWHRDRAQPLALEVLKSIVGSSDLDHQLTIGEVFASRNRANFKLNLVTRQLVQMIGQSPETLFRNGRKIVVALRPFTDQSPLVIYQLIRSLVTIAGDRLGNHQTDLPMASGALTEMVLTLYRAFRFQEQGLELFEDLLDLNLKEAQEALFEIDREVHWKSRLTGQAHP
jgi:hypothetical protein